MIYLHLRLMEGWSGRRAMWALVFSFAAVLFTYLGMNLLPTAQGSLHAYR
jgi:ABC-type transport system involved in cytochrome c biogenesis permease subunit